MLSSFLSRYHQNQGEVKAGERIRRLHQRRDGGPVCSKAFNSAWKIKWLKMRSSEEGRGITDPRECLTAFNCMQRSLNCTRTQITVGQMGKKMTYACQRQLRKTPPPWNVANVLIRILASGKRVLIYLIVFTKRASPLLVSRRLNWASGELFGGVSQMNSSLTIRKDAPAKLEIPPANPSNRFVWKKNPEVADKTLLLMKFRMG